MFKHILNYQKINLGKKYDFKIAACDTDSVKFYKDQHTFTPEEVDQYLDELNTRLPKLIKFETDGVYEPLLVIKTKNYVYMMDDERTIKGSALKCSMKEPALKEMVEHILESMMNQRPETPLQIYNQYVLEASNIQDIKRWCAKKTLTKAVLTESTTTGEKLNVVIQGRNLQEGDKFWVYFKSDESYGWGDEFDGDYHLDRMLKKVYDTVCIFETVLDVKSTFLNYKLKRNKKALQELIDENTGND